MKTQFNRALYSEQGVQEAVAAFAHLGKIAVETTDAYFVVAFDGLDPDSSENVIDEFRNYALHGTIAGSKTW
ncbi:MAG: hypothetical protein C4523_17825 [Myxococcales bacterium]|nr:MAG: hypothetical protein C4523_17825 [Myxococcales bacterium]